eukprot:TRINITY_DN3267_c0_g1_i1.p1 TRINITY_DN3267_c0_g1~~TRINITY_DN3267_c0_g1_i1.p1  ORF type:complete len:514 (-),score=101.04 TRINITY_DN3267_c0_g1_i1:325-1710(-)
MAALSGSLATSKVRSLCWKVFLGVYDSSATTQEWVSNTRKQRYGYEQALAELLQDPREAGAQLNTSAAHPLALERESPWAQYFERADLERDIDLDVERTYPEMEFFCRETVRAQLRRVLLIYVLLHPEFGYRQGMNELAAPLLYVVTRDARPPPPSGDAKTPLDVLCDPTGIEADAYAMLCRLLGRTAEWFAPPPRPGAPSPVVTKAQAIQAVLLKHDPQLGNHMAKCKVEPQLYTMRWIRLLFSREFHLNDAVLLWDAMLAESIDLALLDYIAVAMMRYTRDFLLQSTHDSILQRLLRYPPVEDVHVLVEMALKMKSNPQGAAVQQPPSPSPVRPASTLIPDLFAALIAPPQPKQPPAPAPVTPGSHSLTQSLSRPSSDDDNLLPEKIHALQRKADQYQVIQAAAALDIESIIATLQVELLKPLPQTDPLTAPSTVGTDVALQALAELKRVRDRLQHTLE